MTGIGNLLHWGSLQPHDQPVTGYCDSAAQIAAGPKKEILEKVLAKPTAVQGKSGGGSAINQQGGQ